MIAIILSIAAVMRLVSLNQSFWLDEATSVTVARDLSISQIVTTFASKDFHPPLYYIFLKGWLSLFGVSEVAARSLSVAFALATVFVTYKIGSFLFNKRVGIVASLLIALSPLHIYYSQEARMYVPVAFFVTCAIYFFIKQKWIYFSVLLILIVMTDYMGLLVLPAFWIHCLITKKKFPFKSFFFAHIPLIVVFLAWMPIFWTQVNGGMTAQSSNWWDILGGNSIKNFALLPTKIMLGRISFENKIIYAASIATTGIFYLLFLVKSSKSISKLPLLLFTCIIPILLGIIISFKIPVFYYFRFIFILPVISLILAVGSSNFKSYRNITLLAFIFLQCIFSAYYLANPKFHREDWRSLSSLTNQDKDRVVLFVANSQMEAFKYYNNSQSTILYGPQSDLNYKTVWLMRYVYDIFDPQNLTKESLEKSEYKRVSEYNFNGVVVWKYEKQ